MVAPMTCSGMTAQRTGLMDHISPTPLHIIAAGMHIAAAMLMRLLDDPSIATYVTNIDAISDMPSTKTIARPTGLAMLTPPYMAGR
jgi:hypothetical protein